GKFGDPRELRLDQSNPPLTPPRRGTGNRWAKSPDHATCPHFSSRCSCQIFPISPVSEEGGQFRQLFLQFLRVSGAFGSRLSGFVALLLSPNQQRLERF